MNLHVHIPWWFIVFIAGLSIGGVVSFFGTLAWLAKSWWR